MRRRTGGPDPTGRAGADRPRAAAACAPAVFKSAAFARFLEVLGSRPGAEVVDLGPVIGSNIEFLSERCRVHVTDLYAHVDRHIQQDMLDRFALRAGSIDGVLCWDVFDHVDAAVGSVLAGKLTRMLRPGGALLGLFATVLPSEPICRKYVIEDADHLRYRTYSAPGGRHHRVLQNREVIQLFDGLEVSESVLLKSQLREMLFRKPPTSA